LVLSYGNHDKRKCVGWSGTDTRRKIIDNTMSSVFSHGNHEKEKMDVSFLMHHLFIHDDQAKMESPRVLVDKP
jgi:hypothetical protein